MQRRCKRLVLPIITVLLVPYGAHIRFLRPPFRSLVLYKVAHPNRFIRSLQQDQQKIGRIEANIDLKILYPLMPNIDAVVS